MSVVEAGGVTVRLARPEEYDAVGDLLEQAYAHDYDIAEDYRTSLHDVAGRAATGEVWVAVPGEGDTPLLGSVWTPRPGEHLSSLADEGEVDFRLLGVHPSARGRGVGRLLTTHVIELARARGGHRVVMNSGPQMVNAHRLYFSLGFVRLTERETYTLPDGRILYAFGLDLTTTPSHPSPSRKEN